GRRHLHAGADLAGPAHRARADGRGVWRHADRQHGGHYPLVSAGSFLHPHCRGAVGRPARQSGGHHTLPWPSEAIGWRAVFGAAVGFTALGTVAIWLIVRDAPPGHPFLARTPEPPSEMLRGLVEVL